MAVPGTGSTNQSLTFAAAKKLAGKAHTSNLKEIYNETIPSNVQLDTSTLFGEAIPQTVSTETLYARYSASVNDPVTVEYVEFYIEDISGTTYDANTGSFGDVGFGGGDAAQDPGAHGYQLRLTSSYQTLSSNALKGTGFFLNNQTVHETNGGLQLVNPSFGPQAGNNYGLQIYTAHPDNGGLQIPTTSPIEWSIDYFNGTIFVQDFLSSAKPRYARGFIYIGKTAKTLITEASSSGGGGGISYSRRAVSSTITSSISDTILGVSGNAAIDIRLPAAGDFSAGQYFTVKDESGAADTKNITILASGSQTIDGSNSIVLESPFAAVNIYSNGTDKFFIY